MLMASPPLMEGQGWLARAVVDRPEADVRMRLGNQGRFNSDNMAEIT